MGATMRRSGPVFEAVSGAHARWPHPGVASRLTAAVVAALVTTVALANPAWAVPLPWKNCGQPTDHVRFTRVDVSVWPPQRGHAFVLSVSGTLDETVTELGASVNTSVDGTSLPGLNLPVSPVSPGLSEGPFTKTISFTVPSWLPSGLVVEARVAARDQSDQELACVDLTVPIK